MAPNRGMQVDIREELGSSDMCDAQDEHYMDGGE
jgi:hypothetical protein